MIARPLIRKVLGARHRIPSLAVQNLGVPPAWVGYRSINRETVGEYLSRVGAPASALRQVHAPAVFRNAVPRNIGSREELPGERGWWKFSFRDVPERKAGETFVATVPNCRVLHTIHPTNGQYRPAILTRDDRSLELREIRFRTEHASLLRHGGLKTRRVKKATWIWERVYNNHAHWITGHLPKLILLRSEGLLDGLFFPHRTTGTMEHSLEVLGIDRGEFPTLDLDTVLEVEELTVIGSDRFRPELLQSVRDEFARGPGEPRRRVFISRANATKRLLRNESEIWPLLEAHGFERVFMEELTFAEQIELMADASVVLSLHGAGLANIAFCAPGTQVVELVDLENPSPNFYAVAAALEHDYWFVPCTAVEEDRRPMGMQDVVVDPDHIRSILPAMLAATE